MNIGPIIREKRLAQGWSLQDLATRVEASKTYIWQLEKEEGHSISLRLTLRIAETFGMTRDEFLTTGITPSKSLVLAIDLVRQIESEKRLGNQ